MTAASAGLPAILGPIRPRPRWREAWLLAIVAVASLQQLLCAPSLFVLWILDELEHAAADLRSLMTLRRPGSRPSDPSE